MNNSENQMTMNLTPQSRVNEPTGKNTPGKIMGGIRHKSLPLKVHYKKPCQIKIAMLRDSATVDISRLGKTIQKLHKAEKEGQGKLKRKAFDLLKEHFKLRQFFKKLDEKLAQIEKQLALPITLEQFSSLKRELKDLQTESHLYQEIRFRLGKSYLNCQ